MQLYVKTIHEIGWLGSYKNLHKGISKLVLSLDAVGQEQQPAAAHQLVLTGKKVLVDFSAACCRIDKATRLLV